MKDVVYDLYEDLMKFGLIFFGREMFIKEDNFFIENWVRFIKMYFYNNVIVNIRFEVVCFEFG